MHATMPTVSALFSGGVSVGLLAGVVSGLFYLVVAGIRWAGEVRQQSGEWLFRQVRRRLDAAPAAPAPASAEPSAARAGEDGASMEPEALRVREFMERLVEALVAGELDDVCVRRLHAHPDYERMFACHHGPLCEALARLSFALQMAIANKPMDGEDSPSAAHAALKRLVQQIIQEAMVLPKFKGVRPSDDDLKSLEEMESKTYEDILATAILNKVIERYQQQQADGGGGGARDGNSNLLTPELVSLVAMHRPPAHGDSEAGVGSPKSDDGDSLSEFGCADPLSVTIEECIEEVTTFSNADEEDAAEAYLPGLDVFKKRRAPFPEYGRDVIDGPPLDLYDEDGGDEAEGEDEDEAGSEDEGEGLRPTDVINPVDSWEENWLFQRRRLKAGGAPQPMPVPMLVPNPSEDFRALIGDRDAEDVSDLSDCSDGALEDVMRGDDGAAATAKTAAGPGAGAEAQDAHAGELPCEAKNMEFIKAAAEDCLSEFGQQEGEYTEDYATVTRRQLDSLTGASDPDSHDAPQLPSTPMPQHSPETSAVDESVVAILDGLVPGESEDQGLLKDSPVSTEMAKPPRPGTELSDDEFCTLPAPGTIAEREHKKWETAPPLPNNPYSPENIYKRLNKKYPYARTSSSSDASVEFPELNAKPEVEKAIEQPLQVICSPSDVDYKRYGRDYYINAENNSSDKKKPSMSPSPVPPQQQDLVQEYDTEITECAATGSDQDQSDPSEAEAQESDTIETKVALWQNEINQADQYYQNILNKRQDQSLEQSLDDSDHQVNSATFFKSMLSSSNNNNNEDDYDNGYETREPKHIKDELGDFEKKEKNEIQCSNGKNTDSKLKSDLKSRKLHTSFETLAYLPKNGIGGSSPSLYENVYEKNDLHLNGYSRSDSPSGSSILTSDSEYSMPSVRELTKRFSGLVDSDSSASTPKSASPAPQSRKKDKEREQLLRHKEKDECPPSLSPPRHIREIHSLTARSISREFREELRHHQAVPLNKNIYKQINPKLTNGIAEENSTSSNTSLSSTPKSPVPCRSMQSSIAFWEQMQKNKS